MAESRKFKLTAKEKQQIEEDHKLDHLRQLKKEKRLNDRRLLKEYQPTAFSALDHALKTGRISHACLFHGPRNSMKKEMAFLLAESLLCFEADGLADESRLSARDEKIVQRTADGEHADLIFLDGYRKKQIFKEEVDLIQTRFSKTALEGNGRRVYIIDHAENSSESAMNSLLKFLEEPADGVYAILTADNLEGILPTVRSRCVLIPFRPLPKHVFMERALAEGIDSEDAYFLSGMMAGSGSMADTAASIPYQTGKKMLKQFLDIGEDRRLLLTDYDVRYRARASRAQEESAESVKASEARDVNLDILNAFFTLLMGFCRDVITCDDQGPSWYHNAVLSASKRENSREIYGQILKIAAEERDLVNRNNDLTLLLAQALFRIEEIYD